jgi:hypothetical protein
MRLIATMTADRTQIVFSPAPLPEFSAGAKGTPLRLRCAMNRFTSLASRVYAWSKPGPRWLK